LFSAPKLTDFSDYSGCPEYVLNYALAFFLLLKAQKKNYYFYYNKKNSRKRPNLVGLKLLF
jgi:hypothetical protein